MTEEKDTAGNISFVGKAQVRKFALIQLVHALALEINTPFRVGRGERPSTVARRLVQCSQTRKPDVLRELVAYCHEAFGYEARDSVAKALALAEPWEWEIHGDYGSGWELETTAASEFEARMSYDDYAKNVPDVPHRIAKRRPEGYVKPARG